ncbi:MAG: nicotinamide-nucleotide adenylyltransferase [Thermoplasmata archaeon]
MRAIIPGRYQPFHKGHLYLLDKALKENEEIMIVVENAGESFTFENPMTSGERIEMIINVIKNQYDNEMKRIFVFPMENIKNNAEWVNHLKVMLPRFDICYSNNNLVKILMESAGIEVKSVELLERNIYSGTEIRKRISMGLEWREFVPLPVYDYIMKNGIDKRIKELGMKN